MLSGDFGHHKQQIARVEVLLVVVLVVRPDLQVPEPDHCGGALLHEQEETGSWPQRRVDWQRGGSDHEDLWPVGAFTYP